MYEPGNEEECFGTQSYRHVVTVAFMNSLEVGLPVHGLHKTNTLNLQ